MSLSDMIFGKPHRVLQIKMMLVDEDTNEILARKTARVHETDIAAGHFMLTHKLQELWQDVGHHLPRVNQ